MGEEGEAVQEYKWEAIVSGDAPPDAGKWVKHAGPAKATYPNGDVFQGEFNDAGQRHGSNCTYTWNTAEGSNPWLPEGGLGDRVVKYEGGYDQGVRSGMGKMWYPNGDRYHGLWVNGKKHGEGTFFYASGDVYSGNWDNDVRSGKGTYVFSKDKSQLIGDWANGNLTGGKWVFEDGTSYHGYFKNNKPIGKGVFYFPNGNQQEGEYAEEGEEDEEAPKRLVWRGGPVIPSIVLAADLIRAPLPPASK